MKPLNSNDLISGVLQSVVPGVLGYAVAKGWIMPDAVPEITAAVVTTVCAWWSVYTNMKTS